MTSSDPASFAAQLLPRALSRNPARPAVTFYDEATGERAELSVATLDNWVAKTANLLQDELGLEPGARVAVHLPAHWLGPVWILACWALGLVVCPGGPADGADLLVVGLDEPARDGGNTPAPAPRGKETVAVSLRPLGAPLSVPPPAAIDYAREVSGFPDRFVAYDLPAPDLPALDAPALGAPALGALALDAPGRVWTQRDVVPAVPSALTAGERLLCTLATATVDGVIFGVVAPLAVDTGVVVVRSAGARADSERLATICRQEQAAVTAGVDVPGLRRLV